LGQDVQFYVSAFARDYAIIKSVDDKTMYVYDLESPLYIENGTSLWKEKIFDPAQ